MLQELQASLEARAWPRSWGWEGTIEPRGSSLDSVSVTMPCRCADTRAQSRRLRWLRGLAPRGLPEPGTPQQQRSPTLPYQKDNQPGTCPLGSDHRHALFVSGASSWPVGLGVRSPEELGSVCDQRALWPGSWVPAM